jgi:hypothetical protein
MAQRIQRQRTRGWRMPANTIYVGRPTCWGNYYNVTPERSRADAYSAYYIWLKTAATPEFKAQVRTALKGKNLACWCRLDQQCHADLLLKLANEED